MHGQHQINQLRIFAPTYAIPSPVPAASHAAVLLANGKAIVEFDAVELYPST